MNSEQLAALLRTLLQFGGGIAVGRGWIDADTATAVTGAIVTIAVAEGRVAYGGQYGSYGRMIIVDHGDAFYTVYAGLGRMTAAVGDVVVRGTRLGETPEGDPSTVFFEVRRSTRGLDPRSWTGIVR